ncbi:hypothetical protein RRG08_016833 [Elysia crispata]|uniref:Uncharacterized protein n=1 Tax=Elysia crispata TaxID=231223 RepID=A0AAE1DBW0_9GAST|nr:hypothetical protein RRG08_016833 [Elysia crispata]
MSGHLPRTRSRWTLHTGHMRADQDRSCYLAMLTTPIPCRTSSPCYSSSCLVQILRLSFIRSLQWTPFENYSLQRESISGPLTTGHRLLAFYDILRPLSVALEPLYGWV